MFGLVDIIKFLISFFLILPIVTLLHEAGHVFFAKIVGGKKVRVAVGAGDTLYKFGIFELRKYYFMNGECYYERLRFNNRFTNGLIYAGGIIFNSVSALFVNGLVESGVWEPGIYYYQFIYFSFYTVFFAALPMSYPNGGCTDGKLILDLIRNKPTVGEMETVYIVEKEDKDEESTGWQLMKQDAEEKQKVRDFPHKAAAVYEGEQEAEKHKPSRLFIYSKQGEVEEERVYNPLPE
ncbi:site-2 protease family protein [Aneurinibacillus migulanus]|uniref:site-2 protease family protein n=1 Tax=Aneurinibacillus migulanus TaxID=47500 RepID=UPI002E22F547|nr:site-2 protease family protein [Aneurinibacillus migulanus]MED4732021.1 site-2 protease family protein [Aneurinibacillus migulanus]